MKVKCINDKKGGGFIKEGKIYTVYAILMGCEGLSLLLSEDFDSPMNHPIESFELLNHSLSPICYFKFIDEKERKARKDLLKAIWGYKEIVYDHSHYYDLLEGELEALKIFERRKEEIDEYEELRNEKI